VRSVYDPLDALVSFRNCVRLVVSRLHVVMRCKGDSPLTSKSYHC
jgi:hypothetical protein